MNARVCTLACAALVFGVASHASAQGFAVRAGANINPDQMYGGGQYETKLTDAVWLQPSGDIGVGNGAKLFAMNADVALHRPLGRRTPWQLVAGGGPAVNIYKLPSYSTTTTGLSLLAGLRHANGVFTEFRVGFLDSPDFRFGVGYRLNARRAHAPASRPRR